MVVSLEDCILVLSADWTKTNRCLACVPDLSGSPTVRSYDSVLEVGIGTLMLKVGELDRMAILLSFQC